MSIFKKSENQSAFLKAGILGFAGSGKTKTATKIAIGLHKYIKAKKPIYFMDTETGSDYVKKDFDENNIELYVNKSRAFVDLLKGVAEAEKEASILIIDSVSHYWLELMDAFKKKLNVKRFTLRHWMPIKEEWRPFPEAYINSKLHIIMCGRAGWDFDWEEDDEGVKELTKTGTKMKAEGEIGFEPSLLIEMERVRIEGGKIGGGYMRRGWVIKDRFGLIDGKFYDNPEFDNFIPHIRLLNLGGTHIGTSTEKGSEDLFESGDSKYMERKQKDIYIEEIADELMCMFGSSVEDKRNKKILMTEIFGSSSKTAVEMLSNERLKDGLAKLRQKRKEIGDGS